MSAPAVTNPPEVEGLLTWADIERRWKPPMEKPVLRQQWLRRTAEKWGLRPLIGTRGEGARFRHADVLRAEERAAGKQR